MQPTDDLHQNVHDMHFLQEKVDQLKADGLFKALKTVEGPNEAVCVIDGQEVINLSSNNYLGFANHPRLKAAAIQAIEKYGVGAGAVRPINGNMAIHDELEALLAEFKGEEAVMVFQSGFNCNAGVIQAIVEEGDLIISDQLNHASIIDGTRLTKAKKMVYPHSDMAALELLLQEHRVSYRNALIITDGVFSMDGDICKLPEIVKLAEQYDCMTYIDDAHASGVLGRSGRGTVDHFDLHGKVDFIIGTLSKAIGVVGGYVAGKKVSIEWLNNRARPFLFSTGNTPGDTGAIIEAFHMLMETEEYTDRLWDNANFFKEKLATLGFNTGHSETPITPIIIGDEALSGEFSKRAFEKGVFVSPIVFPTVPKGTGRVRCMVTSGHTKESLEKAVEILGEVGKELGILSK